jgi:hypothetical protein
MSIWGFIFLMRVKCFLTKKCFIHLRNDTRNVYNKGNYTWNAQIIESTCTEQHREHDDTLQVQTYLCYLQEHDDRLQNNCTFTTKARWHTHTHTDFNTTKYFNDENIPQVICEGWHFTHTSKALPWPHHFTKRGFGPIKLVWPWSHTTAHMFVVSYQKWNENGKI